MKVHTSHKERKRKSMITKFIINNKEKRGEEKEEEKKERRKRRRCDDDDPASSYWATYEKRQHNIQSPTTFCFSAKKIRSLLLYIYMMMCIIL